MEDKLNNINGFDGFSPRYTMIGKLRAMQSAAEEIPRNTSTVFLIIVPTSYLIHLLYRIAKEK
jgi:hypothetical protein